MQRLPAFPPSGPLVSDVKRIAVLRANAVGDFVLTLPALEALRQSYPGAEITLLGKRWHVDFLRGRDGPVDEVIALPAIPGVTVPEGTIVDENVIRGFLAKLKERRFDLALQLHGGGRYSNPVVSGLEARVSAGFQAPGTAALDRNFPYIAPATDLHPRALLLLECVSMVGAVGSTVIPHLEMRVEDFDELDRVLPDLEGPLIVLQPGANDPRRRWSPARFAAVGDALADLGAQVIVQGGPGEARLVEEVCSAMKSPALALGEALTLGGLCALLTRTRVVVSNDTGPAHLARALGVSTVAIYWIGNLHSYGPLSARKHHAATSYRVHCPTCGQYCIGRYCGHSPSFVDDVTSEEVASLAAQLYLDESLVACSSEQI